MAIFGLRASGAAMFALGLVATPARADHPGFAGGAGTSGPIVTLPASTLPRGQAAAALRVTYARPERLGDAVLAERAGRHIHAHNADYLLSPSLGLAYGVTDRFTLALSVPYLHRDDLREGTHAHVGGIALNSVEELGSASGIGDASLLGAFRFAGGEHSPWQAALFAGVKLPTGATHLRDANGERFETEHQSGTGSLDPLLGLAVGRRFERLSIDASALYQMAGSGAQHTRLGDRAQYNLSVAWRVAGGEHHHDGAAEGDHDHGAGAGDDHDHHHAPPGTAVDLILELNGEYEGRQRQDGVIEEESGGHVLYLSPGLRLTPAPGTSASLSVGLPIAQHIRLSHPDNAFRLILGLGFAL